MLFGEMAKMPALAEHYRLHQEEKPDTTLAEFLWLHYFDPSHQNDPGHDHQSLPFHQQGGHLATAFLYALPDMRPGAEAPLPVVDEAILAANFYYCRHLPVGFVGNLFQPPKA